MGLADDIKKLADAAEARRARVFNRKAVTFDMTLFDDASVAEKLTVMTPMDAIFDDSRNYVPDEYWDVAANLQPGQTLRITVEVLP